MTSRLSTDGDRGHQVKGHDGHVGWYDVMASALLGTACLACSRPGRPWCQHCLGDLLDLPEPRQVVDHPPTIASCHYEGCVPAAIVGFKDRNVRSLGPVLGDILALGLEYLGVDALLVPAPSAPSATRRRGFDHTRELADHASVRTGLAARCLLRSRPRRDQAGLSTSARQRNLLGSMWAAQEGTETVIIVDDVRTTGATLTECERALSDAGYSVAGKVVVASVQG